jgi:hypothetical protein
LAGKGLLFERKQRPRIDVKLQEGMKEMEEAILTVTHEV